MGFSLKKLGTALINPVAGAQLLAAEASGITDKLDVLDIQGKKAEETANEVNRILRESAEAGISLNQEQLAKIEELTAPFRAAATDTALPQLTALAFGGNIDYTPSKLYETQLQQGRENILQGQAAGSGIKSSATFGKLSDLVSGLASEDIGRFERGQASLLELGRGAQQGLTQAGSRITGNIADLLTNQQAGVGATAQSLAQQRLATGQTIASGVGGLTQLLALQ